MSGLLKANSPRANTVADLVDLRSEVESLRQQTNSLASNLERSRRARAGSARPSDASPSALETMEEERDLAISRMNYAKHWLLAFFLYANQNHDQFPGSFDEAQPFMPAMQGTETNLTTGQFEILYQGPITNITSPGLTVVLRERQPQQNSSGNWSRAYGFADGHSEIAASQDGNYADWEKRHIIPSQPER